MSDNVYVKAECNNCKQVHGLEVNLDKLNSYIYDRKLIQDVFPNLTPSQRELIMGNVNGMYLCDICWDFNFDDEE